jgi:hypothetical protein
MVKPIDPLARPVTILPEPTPAQKGPAAKPVAHSTDAFEHVFEPVELRVVNLSPNMVATHGATIAISRALAEHNELSRFEEGPASELASLNPPTAQVLDVSEALLATPSVKPLLGLINTELAKLPKDHPLKRQYAETVNRMLMFASVRLAQDRAGDDGRVQHLEVAARLPAVLEQNLAQIHRKLATANGDVTKAAIDPEFADINSAQYQQASATQKFYLHSLSALSPQFRTQIAADPQSKALYSSPNLHQWMLASSGGLRQHYLNTCGATSMNQHLVDMMPHPAALLVAMGNLIKSIETKAAALKPEQKKQNAFGSKGDEVQVYAAHRLRQAKQVHQHLTALLTKVMGAKNPSPEDIRQIVEQADHQLQKLASISNPDQPDPLSKKPFDGWKSSFFATLVPNLVASLIPGKPTIVGRIGGTGFNAYDDEMNKMLVPAVHVPPGGRKVVATKGEGLAKTKAFWDEAFNKGGTIIATEGALWSHQLRVKAATDPETGEKGFFVGDPKFPDYKWVSMREFHDNFTVNGFSR